MFSVTVLAVGRLKEKFYTAACEEYRKRLGAYCKIDIVELPEKRLPDEPSPAEIAAALASEGEQILSRIPRGAWVCVLTPEGKLKSSEELAEIIGEMKLSGKSAACFILGSSFGLAPEVKARADLRLSMSPMTFPHHLARVMLLEQLYRAQNIESGGRYHK